MILKAHYTTADWCHLCGNRTEPLADVWYPENAEHESTEGVHPHDLKYIRICRRCGELIAAVSRWQQEEVQA